MGVLQALELLHLPPFCPRLASPDGCKGPDGMPLLHSCNKKIGTYTPAIRTRHTMGVTDTNIPASEPPLHPDCTRLKAFRAQDWEWPGGATSKPHLSLKSAPLVFTIACLYQTLLSLSSFIQWLTCTKLRFTRAQIYQTCFYTISPIPNKIFGSCK